MGKSQALIADLCDFACSRGADSIEVEFEHGRLFVYARSGNTAVSIAEFERSSEEAKELLDDLHAAARRPASAMIAGHPSKLRVSIRESFGEDAFSVAITRAASSVVPGKWSFTSKQGQYLAYIAQYSTIHRRAPAEADIQQYFRVTPPSIHNMIIVLERNGLIERTPGKARSIRVLVPPEKLPRLE